MAVYFSAENLMSALFTYIQKAKPFGMYQVTYVVFFLDSKSVTVLVMSLNKKKPVEYLRCSKDPQGSFPESDLKKFVCISGMIVRSLYIQL